MIARNIINYSGEIIGELHFPDGTSEVVIAEKLAEYAKAPPTPSEVQDSYLQFSIEQRKEFANKLLEKFKKRNITAGINVDQGLYMHHVLRAYPTVDRSGRDRIIDIMNLAISGDLEIACFALMMGYTDDMSEPFHWLSAERKSYLISELKNFLGWN